MRVDTTGRAVTGLYFDEEADCWKSTGGEPRRGGRKGSSVTHQWTDIERILVVLTINPDTGECDRDMQKRVRAVLPADVPVASIHLVRANLKGALGMQGGFQNPDNAVITLAKRGLGRLRTEAEAELLLRENNEAQKQTTVL